MIFSHILKHSEFTVIQLQHSDHGERGRRYGNFGPGCTCGELMLQRCRSSVAASMHAATQTLAAARGVVCV